MNLQEKLMQLRADKKGILAANFYNFETLSGILDAVTLMKMPVILQLSESSIRYMGLHIAVKLAKTALEDRKLEGYVHLDHGSSIDMVHQCLDAGFDSVMIDASEQDFATNVKVSGEAVKLALKYGANVEAELGFVAKLGQQHESEGFTQPGEAVKFVNETGINALAVAIGSAHGFYKKAPKLDMERLAALRQVVPVPLVLHGSSGIPDAMLQEAIQTGITKVNLATETKNAFMLALKDVLFETSDIDLRNVFPKATLAVSQLISQKLQVIHNA